MALSAAISVIVPVRDARATLPETLDSLRGQTFSEWQAVVLDDGSSDGSRELAERFAAEDSRVKLRRLEGRGAGPARNEGLRAAEGAWTLFLDADDFLAPEALERLHLEASRHPDLDAVYCDWARVADGGEVIVARSSPPLPGIREALATECAFPVHACLARTSALRAAGGFDESLSACEDWDLWQRLARSGARFGRVDGVLAFYRVRQAAASNDPGRMLSDGLRVIDRSQRDARANGDGTKHSRLFFSAWTAGLAVARGEDPEALLETAGELWHPVADPAAVANTLWEAVPVALAVSPARWPQLWPAVQPGLDRCLAALERKSGTPALAARARRALERQIARGAGPDTRVGRVAAVEVELTQPIEDVLPPAGVDRVLLHPTLDGRALEPLELPVCGASIPEEVIADALAVDHAWELLRAFFAAGRYAHDEVDRHDEIGWHVFLGELWERPFWSPEDFYEEIHHEGPVPGGTAPLRIEAAEDLRPGARAPAVSSAVLAVGGSELALLVAPPGRSLPTATDDLVRLATQTCGFELCRAAVRAGLLGRPVDAPLSLAERLRESASNRSRKQPQSARAVLLGRRHPARVATPAARRAELPLGCAADLVGAATSCGDLVGGADPGEATRVRYVPELIDPQRATPPPRTGAAKPAQAVGPRVQVAASGVPILAYHRVAQHGPEETRRWRVTPAAFEEQLRYLAEAGFTSTGLDDWHRLHRARRKPDSRRVVITFDDGYEDFAQAAWPLLREHGFGALLFVVPDRVGHTNDWDRHLGEELRLLDWDSLTQLQSQGVEIGSHSFSHPPLTSLLNEEVVREASASREAICRHLGAAPIALAYPFGDHDQSVGHLVGASGYEFGLTCAGRSATARDTPLALPRIEVRGDRDLDAFVASLGD